MRDLIWSINKSSCDEKYMKINSYSGKQSLKIRKVNIWSINKSSCDEKYMKIKINPDDDLPLDKSIETPSMTIVA